MSRKRYHDRGSHLREGEESMTRVIRGEYNRVYPVRVIIPKTAAIGASRLGFSTVFPKLQHCRKTVLNPVAVWMLFPRAPFLEYSC